MSTHTQTGPRNPSVSHVCGYEGCQGTLEKDQCEWVCGVCGTVFEHEPFVTSGPDVGSYNDERHRNIPLGRDWENQQLQGQGAKIQRLLMQNGPRDPMYRLRQQFDRDIKPHLLQSCASTADVDKCRELYFSLRTTDKEVLEKHYNCTTPLNVRTGLSENVRNVVWAIVLKAEVERDPRHLNEKIGDRQFTYPISGRSSHYIQTCLESLRDWGLNNGVRDVMDEVYVSAIGFIKSIHRRLNFMFKNSSTPLGARRQLGDESRKQQLFDMFNGMNIHHGLNIDLTLAEKMFPVLLEVTSNPSSPFKYPNPVIDRPSMVKSCHLEIVLAVCKRLYPKKKFTRPKVCDAIDACYGWRPKYSNSKRTYGDLATYIADRMLNQEEVTV